MKNVKCKFMAALLVVLVCVVAINAAEQTMQISIVEGVNGSDGWSMFVDGGSGSIDSTGDALRIGYSMNGVTQTYFKIPNAFKEPGVLIKSATLTMELGDFAPGTAGIYYQLVHYKYDTGTVSFANANATNDPTKYTKIDGAAHMQGSYPSFVTSWDIRSALIADVNAGNTYLPLGVRMTRNDGTFYPDSEAADSYRGIFRSSEYGSGGPVLTIVFDSNNYYGTENVSINEGVNGSDGFSSQLPQGSGSIDSTGGVLRIGYSINAATQTYFKIPETLKTSGVVIKNATLTMELGDFAPSTAGIYYQLVHYEYDTGTVSFDNANATNSPANYTKIGGVAHMQGSYPSFVTSWDVKSALAADVNAGNTYLPLGVRMTRSDGTFYPDSEAADSYRGIFWSSEYGSGAPVISVEYTVPYNQRSVGKFIGLPDDADPELLDTATVGSYPPFPATSMVRFNYMGDPEYGDVSADIVIDQGLIKDIQKVIFRNLDAEATSQNIRELSMWVSPASGEGSESDPDFDRLNKASYSVQIFPKTGGGQGIPWPEVSTQGITREADVTEVSRRYILMKIKSNFNGDMGQFYHVEGYGDVYNWEIYSSDISAWGTDSISTCDEVVGIGLSLQADMNKDCYVNMLDLKTLADQWMQCTVPGAAGCIQIPSEMPVHEIASVPVGGIIVNGNLSEWPADSEWIHLTDLYSGVSPYDIKNAKMSLRWDGSTHKIYAAVVVDDTEHHFSNDPNFAADLIEIYSQGSTAGGTGWGTASETKYFNLAQQYIVGHNTTTDRWAAWADKSAIGGDAGFESAITLDGDKIVYELGVKQFINYGGKGEGGGTTVVTNLVAGTEVGFDIVADTVHGSGLYSMISENMFIDKYLDAAQFRVYRLVNSLSSRNCGDWGYEASDITQDCYVNLADFAAVAIQWLSCNDPQGIDCQNNW